MNGQLRDPWFIVAALALALGVYLGLAWALMPSPGPTPPPEARLFAPELRQFVSPEPREKFFYLFGLICIPVLPTFFYAVLSRLNDRFADRLAWLDDRNIVRLRDLAILVGLVVWLRVLVEHTEIAGMGTMLAMAAAVALGLAFLRPDAGRAIRIGFGILTVLCLLLYAGLSFMDENRLLGDAPVYHHFDVLLGAVNQVSHGRTVLVNTTSQYGILFPYVAALAVWPFGLTAQSLIGFFVGLSLLSLVFLYLAIARKTGLGTPLSLAIFIGVVSLVHTFFGLWRPPGVDLTIYYQNYPLRVLFPAFFVWFVPVYFSRKNRWTTLLGYAIAGVGVLWNADTGLVVLIAWTGTLFYDALAARDLGFWRMVRCGVAQACLAVLTLLAVGGLYGTFAWLRSGQFPALDAFFRYQQVFYATGYYCLPMPLWEFWQPLVLVYVVAVFYCMRGLLRQSVDNSSRWYFFVALCGLGIFSYYQGRSHHACLLGVIYPAALLAGVMAVDLAAACRAAGGARRLLAPPWRYQAIAAWALFLLPAVGIVHFCCLLPCATARVMGRDSHHRCVEDIAPQVELVKKYISDQEAVILSQQANYFHVRTNGFSALPFGSPLEIALMSQVEEVQKLIDGDDVRWIVVLRPCRDYSPPFRFDKFDPEAAVGDIVVLRKKAVMDRRNSRNPSDIKAPWIRDLLEGRRPTFAKPGHLGKETP